MNIFLTGGSGFLGRRVIEKLIADGQSVWALARSASSAKMLQKLGAVAVPGYITRVGGFARSLDQIDIVVHCAAPVEFWGSWEKFQQEIINSTLKLARECSLRGVKRFVHISSESVLQNREDLIDINESHPYPAEPNSYYGKAKKIAEEQLLQLTGDMEVIILRPTFIWGPGCPAFSKITEKVKSGAFVWIDQGKMNFEAVHVDNVAEAVKLSLTGGQHGRIYFVTDGEDSTVRIFFENLFQALGLPIPKRSVPGSIARPIAKLVEFLWKTFGISSNPPLTRFDLAFVSMARRYNIELIKSELKYGPVVSRAKGFKQLTQLKS